MWIDLQRGGELEMRIIPYGYRIENGLAVTDKNESKALQQAFKFYLNGDSLQAISNKLGIKRNPSGMLNLLADKRYLGTDFYPPLINNEIFDQVQKAHQDRKRHSSQSTLSVKPTKVCVDFEMEPIVQHSDDPYAQAQYIYSLIKEKE
jgi:hypothetical protein